MTLPTDEIPWEDLTAYLAGTLPPAEVERLRAWIADDPARGEFFESLRAVWDGAAQGRSSWDARAALDAIKRRAANEPKVLPLPSQFTLKPTPARRPRPALIAAAVAVICGGGWWIASTLPDVGRPQAMAAPAVVRYTTARGQRLALKLPDGSGVMLGPESALRYTRGYGTRDRVVELEGDGSFEVIHDATRPFEVRTPYARARDLGTRFVVQARAGAAGVDVAVAEGRVALGRVGMPGPRKVAPLADSLVLDRGDWGRVTPDGNLVQRQGVTLDQYFGWTEGRLVFENAALADVVVVLNRWYDVEIQLAADGVSRRRLTAVFRDQPITTVLSLLHASLGVKVTGAGRHFTLALR